MTRVVLVTGVSQYLGARVATALQSDPNVDRVIGVDATPPPRPLGRAEFVPIQLHDGSVNSAVRASGADTVLHLGFTDGSEGTGRTKGARRTPQRSRKRGSDPNLLGTMQLLAACQSSSTIQRLVVRSTAAIHGVSPLRGAGADQLPEADYAPISPSATEAVDVERYVGGLARRRPDISVAVVRLANVIGPSVDSPLTRYLRLSAVPTVRGYDPRMQFIHEDDSVEVIRRMSLSGCAGVFHAAAPGAMPLSAFLRRAGRVQLPMRDREFKVLGGLARRGRRREYSPARLRRLCYDGVLDCGELERALGWRPRYTSQEAFDALFHGHQEGYFAPPSQHEARAELAVRVLGPARQRRRSTVSR